MSSAAWAARACYRRPMKCTLFGLAAALCLGGCCDPRGVGTGWDLGQASLTCRQDRAVSTAATCDACCKRADATFAGHIIPGGRGNGCDWYAFTR